MVRRQRSVNDFSTTLNGAITDSATSATLTSVTGLPTEGDYFLDISGEIVLVTHLSGFVVTIIRGQEGTTAVSHTSGQNVTDVITAGEFSNRANERMGLKALPYGRCTSWDGTTLTQVTSADFTLYNTGSGTAIGDGNDGTIWFTAKDMSGNDLTMAGKSFGSGAGDKRIIAHVACPTLNAASPDILHFTTRQSSGGTVRGLELWGLDRIGARDRTSFLTTGTDTAVHGVGGRNDFWGMFTLEHNFSASSERLRAYYSKDGVNWWLAHTWTFAGSTFQIGIGMTNITGTVAAMRCQILSWHDEPL